MNELLQIHNLQTHFLTENAYISAIQNLNLSVYKGEIIALVGESGCGKSVMAGSILRLFDESSVDYCGNIFFNDKDILTLNKEELKQFRQYEVSMIFQDPQTSLNPLLTIGQQLVEAIKLQKKLSILMLY